MRKAKTGRPSVIELNNMESDILSMLDEGKSRRDIHQNLLYKYPDCGLSLSSLQRWITIYANSPVVVDPVENLRQVERDLETVSTRILGCKTQEQRSELKKLINDIKRRIQSSYRVSMIDRKRFEDARKELMRDFVMQVMVPIIEQYDPRAREDISLLVSSWNIDFKDDLPMKDLVGADGVKFRLKNIKSESVQECTT